MYEFTNSYNLMKSYENHFFEDLEIFFLFRFN